MFYPNYKEMTVKTTVKKDGSGEDTRYIPDLPITNTGLCLVYCMGRNFYAYPLPPETEGQPCICHVVYPVKDDEIMQKFAGKLGLGNEVTKLSAYKDIVKQTVGEQKIAEEKVRLTSEAEAKGEVVKQADLDAVEYSEADKDDGVPLWVFQTKEYIDK
jgi:hypothetical protein